MLELLKNQNIPDSSETSIGTAAPVPWTPSRLWSFQWARISNRPLDRQRYSPPSRQAPEASPVVALTSSDHADTLPPPDRRRSRNV